MEAPIYITSNQCEKVRVQLKCVQGTDTNKSVAIWIETYSNIKLKEMKK